jgi:hypothetical protein
MIVLADMPNHPRFSDLNNHDALLEQARELYERCLTEGVPDPLIRFIDELIAQDPPRTQVLRDIADDLHQRLITLREQYFEARDRVLYIVRLRFALDLTPLVAPKPEIYHRLPIDDLINSIMRQKPLTPEDAHRLRRILQVSHAIAAQVFNDAEMTEHMHVYINDWLIALNTRAARRPTGRDAYSPSERIQ